jgi:hypothetical protein
MTPGGRPAPPLETANEMTSRGKACYRDILKCLARRWPRDAEFSNASSDFAHATINSQ